MKKVLLGLLALNFLTGCGVEIVSEGYRGIKTFNGAVVGEPLDPGMQFYTPFFGSVKEFEVREKTWEDKTAAFTLDTQNVAIAFAVTYYPDPKMVNKIYSQFGWEWERKLIAPVVLGAIKDTVGQYSADTLVGKREQARRDAELELKETMAKRSIIITNFTITNLDFDDQYEQAVEAKVTAVQHAIAEKNRTEQIKEQAKQTMETARANAESMRIQTQALNQGKTLVQYEFVKKWNGMLPSIIMGDKGSPILDMRNFTPPDPKAE